MTAETDACGHSIETVSFIGLTGEHKEAAFEPLRFNRSISGGSPTGTR